MALNFNLAGRVRIGQADSSLAALFQLTGDSNAAAEIQQWQFSNDAAAPSHDYRKARGTYAAPADAQIGDRVIDMRGLPRSSASATAPGFVFSGGAVRSYVDGPGPLVSGQNPPSRLMFETNLQNAASQEQAGIFSNGFYAIGNALCAAGIATVAGLLHVAGNATVEQYLQRSSADATAPEFRIRKSRGTVAAPGNVVLNDVVAIIMGRSYSNAFVESASIRYAVDVAVVAGQIPASRIELWTGANNASPAVQAALHSDGNLYLGSAIAPLALNPTSFPTDGHIFGAESARHLYLARASTANGFNIGFHRSRGTLSALANVVDGDRIQRMESNAYSGATGFWAGARIDSSVDGAVVDNQRPGTDLKFYTNAPNAAVTLRLELNGLGNMGVFTSSYGTSSVGVIGIGNRTTAPTGNPAGGGVLYADAGALKWRGSGGTTTTIAAA